MRQMHGRASGHLPARAVSFTSDFGVKGTAVMDAAVRG